MAQQSGGMPYIGSLISLISKTGVRYEGTLYTIDMQESTIALQGGKRSCCEACIRMKQGVQLRALSHHAFLAVRSFGTEGRKQDGPQIPASDQLFEFIRFRGKSRRKPLDPRLDPRDPERLTANCACCNAGSDIADLTVVTNGPPVRHAACCLVCTCFASVAALKRTSDLAGGGTSTSSTCPVRASASKLERMYMFAVVCMLQA